MLLDRGEQELGGGRENHCFFRITWMLIDMVQPSVYQRFTWLTLALLYGVAALGGDVLMIDEEQRAQHFYDPATYGNSSLVVRNASSRRFGLPPL